MRQKVVVIGAGINGLVAAHYLQRAGCPVLLLERKDRVGGACTFATFEHAGKQYHFPTGASVFGMMQDFIFRDTGLAERFPLHRAAQPPLVYFKDEPAPFQAHSDITAFAAEARARWGETGDVVGYERDLDRVSAFLIAGYRAAASPSWDEAVATLGEPLARRWIAGSALDLLDHYFTADRTKIFHSMSVTESGPVPMNEPGTAFNVAVMATGTVLDGKWGHVKGALWRLPLALADINRDLGVEIVTGASLLSFDAPRRIVSFSAPGATEHREQAGAVFFATDPVTAASAVGDTALQQAVARRKYLGSSGKVVLFFREPVVWKGGKGDDFNSANRFLYAIDDFETFQRSNDSMRERNVAFSPSCFQVYCEGAAQRCLGRPAEHDYLSVFFKDVGFGPTGPELPEVKRYVEALIASRIENAGALFHSVLLTPRDLRDTFYFPEGNIDHQELRGGQNFADRGLSDDPRRSYYRLGGLEHVYYCGAGSYPCGSVAGTPGYMAAMQFLRS
jgi:phytoene dehydrogenase-like protein